MCIYFIKAYRKEIVTIIYKMFIMYHKPLDIRKWMIHTCKFLPANKFQMLLNIVV